MKTTLIIFLSMFMNFLMGQNISSDTVDVYMVTKENPFLNALRIPVNFNKSVLLEDYRKKLEGLAVERIDLVYTTFQLSPEFDQNSLNQERIEKFLKYYPGLDSPQIQWKLIGQSKGKTPAEARELFHGFVIYYRERPTEESVEKEIAFMDSLLLETDGISDEVPVTSAPKAKSKSEDRKLPPIILSTGDKALISEVKEEDEVEELPFEVTDDMCYKKYAGEVNCTHADFKSFVDSIMKTDIAHVQYTYPSFHERKQAKDKRTYNFTYYQKVGCGDAEKVEKEDLPESFVTVSNWLSKADYDIVKATFERNPQWQNSLVIMDVTGSMSPYIAKTMAWVKATQNESQVDAFVFFNDGNDTPDRKKVTGSVGGIYAAENNSFKSVYNEMKSTMRKGGGGDCPENNLEATLEGINKFPECDEIVMVADNWAEPRDLSLTAKIGRPVHVIVCGSTFGINLAYLQLAYDTRGSVHTIEEDLLMRDVKPGKSFKLGDSYYTVLNGKVVAAQIK
ncbi:MAG: hypothetical protein R3277_04610 [Brumimicrobium sp.]|nr:hypothetical protein [Brumimicrobium sp.]